MCKLSFGKYQTRMNRGSLTLILTAVVCVSGCCLRVGPHQTYVSESQVVASSRCLCEKSSSTCAKSPCTCTNASAPTTATVATVAKSNTPKLVTPPAVPARTKIARPALFAADPIVEPNPSVQTSSRPSKEGGSFMIKPLVKATKAAISIPQIESAPIELPSTECVDPISRPTNTLILEIEDAEPRFPNSKDQGNALPKQVSSKLTALFDAPTDGTIQTSGMDETDSAETSTRNIMFAVPPLYPSDIPSIARIVSVEGAPFAQSSRRPDTLSIVPRLSSSRTRPIEPVLNGLRIGRRIEPPATAPTVQR